MSLIVRLMEVERKVELLAQALETALPPLMPALQQIGERLDALEAETERRRGGRPRKEVA